MSELEVLEIARMGLWTLIKVAAPLMLIALGVGLMISLFQALTQIQEMTLSFVPKILAMFIALIIFMPFILETLTTFTEELYSRMTVIGQSDLE